MPSAIPQLEVFVIDLHENTEKENEVIKSFKVKDSHKLVMHDPIKEKKFPIEVVKEEVAVPAEPIKEAMTIAEFTLGKFVKDVESLIMNKKFHVIRTQEELGQYVNVNNNAWITSVKGSKPQYYIRHPKIGNRNVLIEAGSFYDYIYDEYSRELINYCTSHCSAKKIQINKVDAKSFNAKAKISGKHGKVEFSKRRGNVFEMINPHGSKQTDAFDKYLWLEPKLIESIGALTKGGHVGLKDERDFTFEISGGVAKSLGLNLKFHKEFVFSVYVEC